MLQKNTEHTGADGHAADPRRSMSTTVLNPETKMRVEKQQHLEGGPKGTLSTSTREHCADARPFEETSSSRDEKLPAALFTCEFTRWRG